MIKITAQLIIDEVTKRGWRVTLLNMEKSMFSVTVPDGRSFYLHSSLTNLTNAPAASIADDKLTTYMIAKKLGIPVAAYAIVNVAQPAQAQQFAEQAFAQGHSVVVKPTDKAHGHGVTIDVANLKDLAAAIAHARRFSGNIIVQRQYAGNDCRVVVIDGRCIAAATRVPGYVIGDGQRTIAQLVAVKNQDPLRQEGHAAPLTRIRIADVRRHLGAARLAEVPADGQKVTVLGTANLSKGGEAIDITDDIHPSYKQATEKLAAEIGLGICGADFLVDDYRQPLTADTAILLEVNATPGLRMHHFPSIGVPRNVAGALVEAFAKYNGIH